MICTDLGFSRTDISGIDPAQLDFPSHLHFISLKYWRIRGDLIEKFKIVTNKEKIAKVSLTPIKGWRQENTVLNYMKNMLYIFFMKFLLFPHNIYEMLFLCVFFILHRLECLWPLCLNFCLTKLHHVISYRCCRCPQLLGVTVPAWCSTEGIT